jgi:hypothetical protein
VLLLCTALHASAAGACAGVEQGYERALEALRTRRDHLLATIKQAEQVRCW